MSRKRSSSAITASRPSIRSTGKPRWSNARIAEARCATLPSATSTSVSTASLSRNGGQGFESSVCAAPADGRNGDMPKLKPGHVSPTPDEDYAINAAVAADLGDVRVERRVVPARPTRQRGRAAYRAALPAHARQAAGAHERPRSPCGSMRTWCSTSARPGRAGRRASTTPCVGRYSTTDRTRTRSGRVFRRATRFRHG